MTAWGRRIDSTNRSRHPKESHPRRRV